MFRPADAATLLSFAEFKNSPGTCLGLQVLPPCGVLQNLKAPGTCSLFRPASAATLRSFAEFKKSPGPCLGLQVLLPCGFFQN
jgi:hypothetical protein